MSQLDWNATINSIRDSLPQAQFQNWFKPLRLVRYDETSVVVGVPSRFHEEWLKSRYGRKLSDAIRNQTGSELQLEFEVLVMDENVEASHSHSAPPLPTPGTRPALRVIDSTTAPPIPDEKQVDEPNYPPITHHFIELDYNKVAYQCALMLVHRTVPMNPLVIQATVGMGKTHLLSEISERMAKIRHNARIRYTNAELFTAEMVGAIKSDSILSFKRKYREETEVLLFDDLQGLTRRIRTQEELLHIFNEITTRGGQVVFTSSIAPHRLEDFIDPLKSRLISGVIAEVKQPSYDDRVKILNSMCEKNRICIDPLVVNALAHQTQKDVRELIGTLLRIHLQATLENKTLDSQYLASEGLSACNPPSESVTLDEIILHVEHNFAISRNELTSKSRKALTTWARQVAMYLARHYTLLSLEEIGRFFGRDHATVIHAFQKVTETMEAQPTRRYEVEFLKQKLHSRAPKTNDVPPI